MALNRTVEDIALDVRRCADVESRTDRFPDSEIFRYVNMGLAALHRKLRQAIPDQRWLASSTITTEDGVATYNLPSDFRSLISVDLTAEGSRRWLTSYMMHERPELVDSSEAWVGIPFTYRLRGSVIELLPTPNGEYSVLLWYVPDIQQVTDAEEIVDTIDRLDQYVIWWAAREVLFKDKHMTEYSVLGQRLKELEEDIYVIARSRDLNSPPRVTDVTRADRFGRRRIGRWR